MTTKIALLVACLPAIAVAGTDCTVKEFPDRYEVVCIGDAKDSPAADVPSGGPSFGATAPFEAGARGGTEARESRGATGNGYSRGERVWTTRSGVIGRQTGTGSSQQVVLQTRKEGGTLQPLPLDRNPDQRTDKRRNINGATR